MLLHKAIWHSKRFTTATLRHNLGRFIVMNEFKFTWEARVGDELYTREVDKNFSQFISNTPYIFKVVCKETKQSFQFLITENMKPIFYRRVYGKCALSTMVNSTVKVVYVFGYEKDGINTLICQIDGKYYITNDDEKLVVWE